MQAVPISFQCQQIYNCITMATIKKNDKDTHDMKNIKHHPYPNKMESNSWSSTCSGNGSSISRNLQEKLLSASHYFLRLVVVKEAFYIMIYEVLEKVKQFLNRGHQLKIVNTRTSCKTSFTFTKHESKIFDKWSMSFLPSTLEFFPCVNLLMRGPLHMWKYASQISFTISLHQHINPYTAHQLGVLN